MPKVFETNHKIEIVEYGDAAMPDLSLSKIVKELYQGACKFFSKP